MAIVASRDGKRGCLVAPLGFGTLRGAKAWLRLQQQLSENSPASLTSFKGCCRFVGGSNQSDSARIHFSWCRSSLQDHQGKRQTAGLPERTRQNYWFRNT